MSKPTLASNSMYCFLPTEVEGFGPLAELALDTRWSWNHYADDVWRQLDPALCSLGTHTKPLGCSPDGLAGQAPAHVGRSRRCANQTENGCSYNSTYPVKPVDTSMSFTPTAGVSMSTHSGDFDPELVWYLTSKERMDARQFNDMVNFQSGLLGMSETSSDMRDLLDHETRGLRAVEAVALFCYQVKKWIGAFAAALGGLDTLVFAGGIEENASPVCTRICDGLGFLGIEREENRNATNAGVVSANARRVVVRVIHTDEEWTIANAVSLVSGLTIEREPNREKGV